jgi:hypothetical protein
MKVSADEINSREGVRYDSEWSSLKHTIFLVKLNNPNKTPAPAREADSK